MSERFAEEKISMSFIAGAKSEYSGNVFGMWFDIVDDAENEASDFFTKEEALQLRDWINEHMDV